VSLLLGYTTGINESAEREREVRERVAERRERDPLTWDKRMRALRILGGSEPEQARAFDRYMSDRFDGDW
jgi:hypothetical protein